MLAERTAGTQSSSGGEGLLWERGDLAWRKDGRDKGTEEGGRDVELRGREKASFTFPGKAESGQAGCRPGGWNGHTGCGGSEGRVRRHRRNKLLRDAWTARLHMEPSTPAARPSSGHPAAWKAAGAWASPMCRVLLGGGLRAPLAKSECVGAQALVALSLLFPVLLNQPRKS